MAAFSIPRTPRSGSGVTPLVLDPNNSERQYWRDPCSGILREIWRPGDPAGEPGADYFGRPEAKVTEPRERWRLYQTGHVAVSTTNVPPAYVVLDDLAAWQVYDSDIPRSHRVKFWSHDFAGAGGLRALRTHRGRGAIGDENATGLHQYFFGHTGLGQFNKYYFMGEQSYRPVIYIDPEPEHEHEHKRKASTPPLADVGVPKQARGHNQHTPKPLLVKHGAPSQAKNPHHYKPCVNTFLTGEPEPSLPKSRYLQYNQGNPNPAIATHAASTQINKTTPTFDPHTEIGHDSPSNESMFIDTGTMWSTSDISEASDIETSPQDLPYLKPPARPYKKPTSKAMTYIDRVASGQEFAHERLVPAHPTQSQQLGDSGSYAEQKDRELDKANAQIATLRARVVELETEVRRLHGLGERNARLEHDDDDR